MFLQKCFEIMVENISEAVMIVNKDGIFILINKKAEYSLGISAENDLGKYVEDVIPEIQMLRILKMGKNEFSQKFKYNGREFTKKGISITINGKIEGAMAIFHDTIDHKIMEKKLTEHEVYMGALDTIMNALNECIVVVDEKGIITMMSNSYKKFLGCSNPEGKFVEDVIENTKLNKVVQTGKVELGDLQNIKGNKMIAMRVPLKKDGKIIGAVGKVIFKDIGDFRILSNKLNNLEKEVEFYKNVLGKERRAKYSIENIIGQSDKIKDVKCIAEKVAKTSSNVLIVGESGTGKELFAHAIHNASKRSSGPFVEINCAAIPLELLESEFFGYEEGAFTGAKKGGKIGKFELANKGTIFLDEIGDMPMEMQVKLLKTIQEKEIERIGSNTIKEIDVRIIVATNKNLEDQIKKGKFREDLYYRLNVIKIALPPLRERKDDIPMLANSLRIKIANKLSIYVEGISKEAIECLINYDWPGNIRELENVIERAVNLLDSDLVIELEHLPEKLTKRRFKRYVSDRKYLKDIVEDVEKEIIFECLQKTNWNKNKTSQILGISRAGLYKKISEYKLESL